MAAIEVTDSSLGLEPFMLAAVGLESDFEDVHRLLVEYHLWLTFVGGGDGMWLGVSFGIRLVGCGMVCVIILKTW